MTVIRPAGSTVGDILTEAWRPGTVEPVAIHIRPEVYARMLAQMTPLARDATREHRTLGYPDGIPLLVDGDLPPFPGFEVHRRPPTENGHV